jgi:hypothetical protein
MGGVEVVQGVQVDLRNFQFRKKILKRFGFLRGGLEGEKRGVHVPFEKITS